MFFFLCFVVDVEARLHESSGESRNIVTLDISRFTKKSESVFFVLVALTFFLILG